MIKAIKKKLAVSERETPTSFVIDVSRGKGDRQKVSAIPTSKSNPHDVSSDATHHPVGSKRVLTDSRQDLSGFGSAGSRMSTFVNFSQAGGADVGIDLSRHQTLMSQ